MRVWCSECGMSCAASAASSDTPALGQARAHERVLAQVRALNRVGRHARRGRVHVAAHVAAAARARAHSAVRHKRGGSWQVLGKAHIGEAAHAVPIVLMCLSDNRRPDAHAD